MLRTRRSFIGTCGALAFAPSALGALGRARPRRGFEPLLGACRSPSDGPAVAAGGGAFLEVSCQGWLVPGKSDDAFAPRLEAMRASPVPVLAANGFLPGSLKSTGPSADHDAVLANARVSFQRARQVGIKVITFGSSGSRSLPDGYPTADAELQLAALLARMGPLAEREGVTVCVEPLQKRETNFINRVSEANRIVGAVQHPNIGITADVFHMLREDEGPRSIRDAGALIRHVHIAEKARRTAPGNDGDDFTPYLQALGDIGYAGLVSIESGWTDLGAEMPKAISTLEAQCAAVTTA